MLVLSRRVGEEIVIADNVYVRIVAVEGRRVRLAIAAPLSVAVHRKEVQQRVRQCPAASAESPVVPQLCAQQINVHECPSRNANA